MKTIDRYRHFKGGIYGLVGSADCFNSMLSGYTCLGVAHDAENPETMYAVFDCNGQLAMLRSPQMGYRVVVYQSESDGKAWFRPWENFFEVLPDWTRRFTRIVEPTDQP